MKVVIDILRLVHDNNGSYFVDWNVAFSPVEEKTLVKTVVQYASIEALQAAINMGLEAGMASTLGRLDKLLQNQK